MYPSHASLRTSVYTTFRVYIPGHRSRYSFTASPSGGDVRTRTPENLPTRDRATYNCPGGPTCQYGRACTMCQQGRTYAAYTPTGTEDEIPCEKTGDGRYTPHVPRVCPWLLLMVMAKHGRIGNCRRWRTKGNACQTSTERETVRRERDREIER